jgi:hypothetical protein
LCHGKSHAGATYNYRKSTKETGKHGSMEKRLTPLKTK